MSNVAQDIGLSSYKMSLAINRAQRAFSKLMKICLAHHDLTIPEWSLLGKLYDTNSIRPIEIASSLGVKPPFVAKLVAQLSEKGLIECKQFDDDERGKIVSLTENGKLRVKTVELKLEHCLNAQLGEIEKTDLKKFFALNEYIAQNVRHH